MKYIFLFAISALLFTGCGLSQKSLLVHKDTLKKPFSKEDAVFTVSDVTLKGDLPNPAVFMFSIKKKDIKQALTKNLQNFYKTSDKGNYQIVCEMDFSTPGFIGASNTISINATYTILQDQKTVLKLNTQSRYTASTNLWSGSSKWQGFVGLESAKKPYTVDNTV
ncbi:MAG: hypothetical protein OIF32_03195, partial [Campylobacterales bacterium]|nr:hypothetical protein [Campylobacterales bacterium]